MSEQELDKMLEDVKNYLDITFKDDMADKKLSGIIKRGMNYLDDVAGADMDYMKENQERQLLFDYCRYARSNDLEAFMENFSHELVIMRIRCGVDDYAATKI